MKIYVEETKKGDFAVVADFGTRAEKFFFKWHEEDTAVAVATLIQEVINTTGGDFSTCRAVFDSDAKQLNVFDKCNFDELFDAAKKFLNGDDN